MADFAAVIRKTLGNMSETTPELRAKVYDKARAAVRRQIDAMEKAPPQAAIDRQFVKLEDAINSVEAEYSADLAESTVPPSADNPAEPAPEGPKEPEVPTEPDIPTEPDVPSEPDPAPVEPDTTPVEPEPAEPAPTEPAREVPEPAEPEPEVPAPAEPEVPEPHQPEPEVPTPAEPEPEVPTPAEPEPEVPTPADPEPQITPPYDPAPEVPSSDADGAEDAPLPENLIVGEADDQTALEPVSEASGVLDETISDPEPVDDMSAETTKFEQPADAVEAVDDVADGLIVAEGAISAKKAIDDASSATVETPVPEVENGFETAAFDAPDEEQASIEDVNKTIGELFGAPADEADVSMPETDNDPLAEFLKEQEANFPDETGDFDVSADSKTDDALSEAVSTVDTVSASAEADPGTVEGERRDTGIPPLVSDDVADEKRGGGAKKASIALVVLALLAGGAYFVYEKNDQLSAFYNETALPWWQDLTGGGSSETEIGDAATTGEENGVPVRTVTSTSVDNNEAESEPDSTEVTTPVVEDVSNVEDTPTKFTQRLTEDGTEIDEGPIEGTVSDGNSAEGSSVSPQTAGTDDAQTAEEEPAAQSPETGVETPATPVGQRAIFYEERTGSQDGTALAGATVWTVVNESPGGELPVEPAIRAETSIPELGLKMEMTIRRNGDSTFPASHIIELFFRVPENFAGRGIADVQRVTFKTNEQDPGNALIAVPAPLDQNIFLIALTDATTAVETNVQLMTRENWIDIPMQYTNGRRALITLEKGIPGERVFKEVFAAWEEAPIEN